MPGHVQGTDPTTRGVLNATAEPAAADVLTSRELQIAVLLAQGFDRKAIGRRLGISTLTVRAHLTRTYSKLGVSRRSTLAARIVGTVALHRQSAYPARESEQALPQT